MADELTRDTFPDLLRKCAGLPSVREEVIKNYADNRWWPAGISDPRLRMIVAGLANRVSYAMIDVYRGVVSEIAQVGYEELQRIPDATLSHLLNPLGLPKARLVFCRSMMQFLAQYDPRDKRCIVLTNDQFINLIAEHVKGAGFKVSQCCALYTRGYECGIIPVDSGMRDKLSRCIGLNVPKTPFGHEIMRKALERFVCETDCYSIARKTGYGHLHLPTSSPLTWWVHLVLIYYKRLYCNRSETICPLRIGENSIRGKCALHQEC